MATGQLEDELTGLRDERVAAINDWVHQLRKILHKNNSKSHIMHSTCNNYSTCKTQSFDLCLCQL